LLLIVLAVVAICSMRRRKAKRLEAATPVSITDKESKILGVAIDPAKGEEKTWNWPEQEQPSTKNLPQSDAKSEGSCLDAK
ncbi:hypothetical protein PENTCL1PPCAC_13237, partial [Pristionchus entomophagus]